MSGTLTSLLNQTMLNVEWMQQNLLWVVVNIVLLHVYYSDLTSLRCSIGLKSGDCEGLCGIQKLSHVPESSFRWWVFWHVSSYQPQQPKPWIEDRIDPCFSCCQILTQPSECHSWNWDLSDHTTFFQYSSHLILVSLYELSPHGLYWDALVKEEQVSD